MVLRDGDYELVVLSPEGRINPYRGRLSTKFQTRQRNYVVTSGATGAQNQTGFQSDAEGDYTLLYAPVSLGPVTLSPKIGLPFVGKK